MPVEYTTVVAWMPATQEFTEDIGQDAALKACLPTLQENLERRIAEITKEVRILERRDRPPRGRWINSEHDFIMGCLPVYALMLKSDLRIEIPEGQSRPEWLTQSDDNDG
jgi:hypothetical protein